MPADEKHWAAGHLISVRNNNEYYELYARKSNEMLFDINDRLMQERCPNGCEIDVKISFKDDRVMGLQLVHANGSSNILTTQGGGKQEQQLLLLVILLQMGTTMLILV